ncbi:MAG: hypothetical protein EZS28_014793 [Streblomastix strix]|uniref:Uncharacterized protein n=1 Tax=Streblomastix strix TaxID=222440 RepID=A0A5J4W4W2_9EUKA|nr:MAG: hypothetical protein EZS28_014793 [Streblomastix strix]
MDFQAIWKQIDNPSLDASLRSQLLKGIENIYNKPPHTEVSILLGMKEYSPDEIRRMIFTPTEQDMSYYPILISPPPKGITNHPLVKTQRAFMSLLYMLHSHSWARIKPFIIAGGLRVLISQFNHEQETVRGQMLDTFLQISSEDNGFDWFEADKSKDDNEAVLLKMRDLGQYGILKKLVSNSGTVCSWMSLQILAFWISFIRRRFTQNGILELGTTLIQAIQNWQVFDQQEEQDKKIEGDFAKQLFDDFSRFEAKNEDNKEQEKEQEQEKPNITNKDKQNNQIKQKQNDLIDKQLYERIVGDRLDIENNEDEEEQKQNIDQQKDAKKEEEQLPPAPNDSESPLKLKEKANSYVKKKLYQQAQLLYSQGNEDQEQEEQNKGNIDNENKEKNEDKVEKDKQEEDNQLTRPILSASLLSQTFSPAGLMTYAQLRNNRAFCLLKIATERLSLLTQKEQYDQYLQTCIVDSTIALIVSEGSNESNNIFSAKCLFRRGQALHLLHYEDQSIIDAKKALELDPKNAEIKELVQNIEENITRTHTQANPVQNVITPRIEMINDEEK